MSRLELNLAWRGAGDFHLRIESSLELAGVTAVFGPSGSGKTSLLECIAGLRRPEHGSLIRFDGVPWLGPGGYIPAWQREIGVVFQDGRLFPHLTVSGNLDYAERRRRGGAALAREDVVEWLELADLLERRGSELSAGQGQRVAIARALLSGPRLLLMDEPLANLDGAARRRCLACLQRIQARTGLPMLYVSHDIEEVSRLADQLLLLEGGKLVEQGPMVELAGRLDSRISHLAQAAAILQARVRADDADYGLTELDLEGQPLWVNRLPGATGDRLRLRIPARDVSVCRSRPSDSSILNILETRLVEIETTTDARVLLRLAVGGQYLLARITRRSADQLALHPGDALYAQVKSAALLNEALDPI